MRTSQEWLDSKSRQSGPYILMEPFRHDDIEAIQRDAIASTLERLAVKFEAERDEAMSPHDASALNRCAAELRLAIAEAKEGPSPTP